MECRRTIALHLGQLSLDHGETLSAPMRTLRLVSRSWSKIAAEFLFELALMQPEPSSFLAVRALASTDLARHVRICEIALCGPNATTDDDIVDYMKAALAVRQFPQLRELNLLLVHEWIPDVNQQRNGGGFGELRRVVLGQLFHDLTARDFMHLQYLTLRTDAESFVQCMHTFDGSRAHMPRPIPPRSILRRLGNIVHLDLCLVLEDEGGRVFFDYPSLGHYIARLIRHCSKDRLRTLALAFSASPDWRLRQYDHTLCPFLDDITLPKLQDLFLEDMRISPVELSDFLVEHMGPRSLLRNVYIAGMLMPEPPLEPTSLDLGGWAQFCRDLSPYKSRPAIQFEAIGYVGGFPLRDVDGDWLQRTIEMAGD